MLNFFAKASNFIISLFTNINNYTFALLMMAVVILSLGFCFRLRFKSLIAILIGIRESFKNLFYGNVKILGLKKYVSFSRSLILYSSLPNVIGVFTVVNLYGKGALFWYFLFFLILSPINFLFSMTTQMFRKIRNGKITGGTPYIYKAASKKIKNDFLKVLFKFMASVAIVSLFAVYIISSSAIETQYLNMFTKQVFNINDLDFLFLIIIPSVLLIFFYNFRKRRVFYIVYYSLFLMIFIYTLVFCLINLSIVLPFFLNSFSISLKNMNLFSMSGIFALTAIVKYTIFASSYGMGISNDFETKTFTKHPVEQGIIKFCASLLSFVFVAFLSFLIADKDHLFNYSDIGVSLFKNVIYFNLGYIPLVLIYLFYFFSFLFVLVISIKNMSMLLFTIKKPQHILHVRVALLVIIIISSFTSFAPTLFISNFLANISYILSLFVVLINIISMILLRKEILYTFENFRHNLFAYKKEEYVFKKFWTAKEFDEKVQAKTKEAIVLEYMRNNDSKLDD